MDEAALWRYYFGDVPGYARTGGYVMPDCMAQDETPAFRAGASHLRECLGNAFTTVSDEEIARRATWVRLARHAETFVYSTFSCRELGHNRTLIGQHHLTEALASKRPLVLLSGHMGSNMMYTYLACQGLKVFPIARSIEASVAINPLPVQWFSHLTQTLSERTLGGGHFLYTNFGGHFTRTIQQIMHEPRSAFVILIDMPESLYSGKRQTVNLFGRPSTLPSNFVRWALKHDALFLTFWSRIEFNEPRYRLTVEIRPPLTGGTTEHILQSYGDQLTAQVSREPWQWMGLPIASQYHLP